MSETSENNKRIAKNTLMLYVRMFVLMLIGLYTSRVILNTLGVDNFGIYNAVGGFVSMFSIISGTLSSAVGRFITYEIGTRNVERLKTVFSTSVSIQLMLAGVIVVIMETAGLWFLNSQMNIPESRMQATNWVFQLSVLTFAIDLISVPYNAAIVAHEKMSAFAYISIFEAAAKLAVAFLIVVSPIDILVFYAILLAAVSVTLRLIYGWYCNRHFIECKEYRPSFDKGLFRQMFSFAGWNFLGNTAGILNSQGVNILMNIFFGVGANAARGVAGQVESVISRFTSNFSTAFNPQITKYYASGEYESMHLLVRRGAKFSYFLMLILAVPILLETETILQLWLKNVPEHAVVFSRLTVISSLVTITGYSLYTAIMAAGNIKRYQIIITIGGCWVFPLSYVAFKLGLPPEAAYIIYIAVYFSLLFVRIHLAKSLINLDAGEYIRKVILNVMLVTLLSFMIPGIICMTMDASILRLVITLVASMVSIPAVIFLIGLEKNERNFVILKISQLSKKLSKSHVNR